jgi:hypothetical protein
MKACVVAFFAADEAGAASPCVPTLEFAIFHLIAACDASTISAWHRSRRWFREYERPLISKNS